MVFFAMNSDETINEQRQNDKCQISEYGVQIINKGAKAAKAADKSKNAKQDDRRFMRYTDAQFVLHERG